MPSLDKIKLYGATRQRYEERKDTMTEQEWLVSKDPKRMVEFILLLQRRNTEQLQISKRRMRLLCYALCSMAGMTSENPMSGWREWNRGEEDDEEAERMGEDVAVYDLFRNWIRRACGYLKEDGIVAKKFADCTRDILGNPYKPLRWSNCELCGGTGYFPIGRIYLTDTGRCTRCGTHPDIIEMAARMYKTNDFTGMGILGDAIEDSLDEVLIKLPIPKRIPSAIILEPGPLRGKVVTQKSTKVRGGPQGQLVPMFEPTNLTPLESAYPFLQGLLEHLRDSSIIHHRGCHVLDMILGYER